jgi:hypothetical protein
LLAELSGDGKLLRYIRSAGSAYQVNALVNMVMNINTAGLTEGLGLGVQLGLDPRMLLGIFAQAGANSRVVATDGEDMISVTVLQLRASLSLHYNYRRGTCSSCPIIVLGGDQGLGSLSAQKSRNIPPGILPAPLILIKGRTGNVR